MRTTIIIFTAVFIAYLMKQLSIPGGIVLVFGVFIVFYGIPTSMSVHGQKRFCDRIKLWMEQNGIASEYASLQTHMLTKGKLGWKASDIQLIFSLRHEGLEYWFACGSWWFGVYNKEISIYQYADNKLNFVQKISA